MPKARLHNISTERERQRERWKQLRRETADWMVKLHINSHFLSACFPHFPYPFFALRLLRSLEKGNERKSRKPGSRG